MTRALAAFVLIGAGCLAGPAAFAFAEAPNQIAGVTVVAGPGPAVQSTYPVSGASVPGGVMIVKIVFDQPMKPEAWAYGPSAGADFPKCLANPRLLADQRTYVLMCSVPPGHAFAMEINPAPRFASDGGRSAKPFTLTFSTTSDVTEGLHDALARAGLTDADDPIMTWRDAGQGVSKTPPAP